jgi:hypothetical protein
MTLCSGRVWNVLTGRSLEMIFQRYFIVDHHHQFKDNSYNKLIIF